MFGKTNSLAAASGGGGDVTKAVNNMGVALTGGEKVWLNRHVFESSYKKNAYGNSGSDLFPYNLNNKFYYRLGETLYRADFKDNKWRFVTVGEVTDAAISRSTQFRHALVWQYISDTKSFILKNMGNYTMVQGIVVSDDKAVINNTLSTYDPITGAAVVTGGAVNPSGGKINAAFLFDNVLFVGCENRKYYFYDVSDILAPVLLNQGAFTADVMVVYATGLHAGNYLIARKSIYANENNGSELRIYKILDGYMLETADDLPNGLQNMIGVNSRVTYNNNTGVLSVGTDKQLLFYQFFDGGFHVLDIALPELPATNGGNPYLARLNDDMSVLVILAVTGYSYTYYDMWFYRLSAFNDKWYAEPYDDSSSASFTGFAVEGAESGAEVSVKTVFPKLLTLTVEVENDGAVIDVKGAR